ncbi:hypothetical protein BBBOND_0210810 [Babesia bigemina]|uniref:Uncharacterized protein n=1 Tax=Babesia bigemina TaxID=5866 RepID=A0A061D5E3_BABBI|nr:hypothetical protein BBBOND_0210810 [Babesia bigemina]CDR95931.1 hypothetical protein BBBOND_0210810 [Babesia bigemina]|eukprot:XP_012768117.1 hypothetical protein BBBOND_0210810 [Babesia bigemina]
MKDDKNVLGKAWLKFSQHGNTVKHMSMDYFTDNVKSQSAIYDPVIYSIVAYSCSTASVTGQSPPDTTQPKKNKERSTLYQLLQ